MKEATKLIKECLDKLNIVSDIENIDSDESFIVNIKTDDSMIIGYKGENLRAFQHIIYSILQKQGITSLNKRLIIDVNSYLQKKNDLLVELAQRAIDKVIQTGHAEVFKPMNAYERRIVHLEISKSDNLLTESIGQDPNRRIVVRKKLA